MTDAIQQFFIRGILKLQKIRKNLHPERDVVE